VQLKQVGVRCRWKQGSGRRTAAHRAAGFIVAAALSFASSRGQTPETVRQMEGELLQAAAWVSAPSHTTRTCNYIVTGSVHLLFFWVSRDDVGQGYINFGRTEGARPMERINLVMGSDPAKAPLGINRWGAAAEISSAQGQDGAFFGFMKTSKGDSAGAMREELSHEKATGEYLFEGIVSRRHEGQAVSLTVPIRSATDFTLHQVPEAEKMVVERLRDPGRPLRTLDFGAITGCQNAEGFLFTVRKMIDDLLSGRTPPFTRCYVYNSRRYSISITGCEPEAPLKVSLKLRSSPWKFEKVYAGTRDARFNVVNTRTGVQTHFRIKFATEPPLRGIPVQIEYQPNWWFKAILNLVPES
jgi:hypothetical protein